MPGSGRPTQVRNAALRPVRRGGRGLSWPAPSRPPTPLLGIALGLLAAVCWASYILLNRVIGQQLPGAEGSAAAAALSALLYVPIGIVTLLHHPPTARALGYAAAAGILASAVPFVADLFVLRRVPARFFGVFMSVNPVLAALIGWVVLDQSLQWAEWLAIAAIVTANTVSVLTADHQAPGPSAASSPRISETWPPLRADRPDPRGRGRGPSGTGRGARRRGWWWRPLGGA